MTLHDDNPVFARLTTLATCLCGQIQDPENGVPDVCFCGIVPGESAAATYAGDCDTRCGMAWVRMANLYPSTVIGQINSAPRNCATPLGVDVEVGILRCFDMADEYGPNPEQLLSATQLQVADAQVIYRAILCCDTISPRDVTIGPYIPLGPQGGLVGGAVTLSMAVG